MESRGRSEMRSAIIGQSYFCEGCFKSIPMDEEHVTRKVGTCHPVANYRIVHLHNDCA